MLAKNRAETLRFRCERQVAVELVRKADAGNITLAKPLRKLLTEWIGQNGRGRGRQIQLERVAQLRGQGAGYLRLCSALCGIDLGKSEGNGGLKNEDREHG